jgi:membrane fusion protein, multidrug efflux system
MSIAEHETARSHDTVPAREPVEQPPNLRRIGIILAVIFIALLIAGIVPRILRQRDLGAAVAEKSDIPVVTVGTVKRAPGSIELSLPGTVQALRETTIFARTNGYVKRWFVDIGGRVTAGQALAEIETPDLDQELAQARATRAQVEANLNLARASLARWTQLVKEDAATKQELDEREAAFGAAQANANASQANVQRLTELQRFGHITAPFSGIVTARNIELGMLITAGGGAGARPLFNIAQADTVRIYVNAPEGQADDLKGGQLAEITVSDLPGRVFHAVVTRTARALDTSTRTMLTQLEMPNPDHALLPGMYATVKIKVLRNDAPLIIPANALIVRSDGPQVAVVQNGKIHLQHIELGRDYGKELEVLSGLQDKDKLVINPGDEVSEGNAVKSTEAPKPDKP